MFLNFFIKPPLPWYPNQIKIQQKRDLQTILPPKTQKFLIKCLQNKFNTTRESSTMNKFALSREWSFHIHMSLNVIYYIDTLKDMIMALEVVFWKKNYKSFTRKVLDILKVQRMYFKIIKAIYNKLLDNTMLNRENLKHFH